MLERSSPAVSEKSWWSKRTYFEKILLILYEFTIIGAIITVVIFKIYSTNTSNVTHICQTEGCITSAARLIQNMNLKVDPCHDFYEFACGRYTKNTHIPDDKVSVNSFNEVRDKIDEQYRTLLESPIEQEEKIPYQYAKKLYWMCMNSSKTEKEEFMYFKSLMKDLGGWPVLEGHQWDENSFDWKATQYNFRMMGLYNTQLIRTYVGVDPKNSTKRIFTITQPYLSKLWKKGFNETIVKAYYDYLVDISILYGADKLQASKDMRQYVDFKIELAKIIVPSEDRRNSTLEYNPMTIRQLEENFPSIDWLSYINTKLEPYVALTYDDVVMVTVPKYLEKLEKLLAVTPKRAIANYLFASIAEYRLFNDEMRRKRLKYEQTVTGVTSKPPKWKECLRSGGLYLARVSMYVRQYMKMKSKSSVQELLKDIKSTFIENLKKYTWMDHKTKKRALQKAEEMKSFVGFPNELLDEKEIDKYYEGFIIHEDSLLKTSLALSIWARNKNLKRYYEPYNKTDWKNKAFPSTVNAFYVGKENSIQIPAGILQQPFFYKDRPYYLNYGSIGYIIGHEIIHGFDDRGRQYNKDGNLVDWWEPAANKNFHEKAQCVVDQYANYTNGKINMTLNGINTQGENIADNGGIKMAYMAYEKWLQRNNPEQYLPGLKFTPKQLFWISAANTWCSKMRPEMEKQQILNDFHSPNYYRTIIPFINSGFFERDFDCPLGSRMNPKYKCDLW